MPQSSKTFRNTIRHDSARDHDQTSRFSPDRRNLVRYSVNAQEGSARTVRSIAQASPLALRQFSLR